MSSVHKYRYIIYGKPCNRHYTIEEAKWCDETQRFIFEKTHSIKFHILKQWIGYLPVILGNSRTVMWMHIPNLLQTYIPNDSPLTFWQNHSVMLAQLKLENLRVWL